MRSFAGSSVSLTSWRRAWAEPTSVPSRAISGLSCQSSRDASQPMSSTPATADSGWWRTVTALIVRRSGRRWGGSNVAATRSRHGVERSHARSTTYASRRSVIARLTASRMSGSSTESSSTTCASESSASTACVCPCGAQTTVGRSVTTSGSTIVSMCARCCSPTSTITVSRSSANSPGRGCTSEAIVATASIERRRGSTAHTIVRPACERPTNRRRLAISPLHCLSTTQTRLSVRAGT